MHLTNKKFGEGKDALTKSIFTQISEDIGPKPPGESFYFITNSGDELIANTEDYLITNGGS